MTQGWAGVEGFAPQLTIGQGNPEALKYGRIWAHDEYRKVAPGEQLAQVFLAQARPRPDACVIDFGCGTGRGALMLAILGNVKVLMLDFVNNCLDPDIKDMLVTQAHKLRFMKVDLEQKIPVVGEYGYCTDVMEHIPRDKVDRVLDNILTAAQHVFFSISTTDDSCGKLIGETLHLTVEPYSWWLKKFNERQCAIHWSQEVEGAALFYVSAWATGGDVSRAGVLNVEEEHVRTNVRHNIAQGWTQVVPHPTNDFEVMILGGGPTMPQFEDDIKQKRAQGVKLITLNGSYNWALDHGLTPSAQIIVDARAFNARFVEPVVNDCRYLISSQCDPSVFQNLPKDRTWIWHTSTDLIKDILDEQYPAWYHVPGGSTVLLRAIPLLRMLGFRRFHLYGCDSCLMNGVHHAYAQTENDGQLVIPVVVTADGQVTTADGVTNGAVFYCHPWMLSQANELLDLIHHNLGNEFELEIYGDGLLAYLLNLAASTEVDESHAPTDADEIIPGLWVGGIEPAPSFHARGFKVLGVRHLKTECDDAWVPILVGNHKDQLDKTATQIDEWLAQDERVYVHCYVGMDRAPLTVAWYLHTKKGMTLDAAYELIKSKHPITKDRTAWIEGADMQTAMAHAGTGV